MFRDALPRRPQARRLLVATLLAAIGQGMTLPFLFIYLTEVRGIGSTIVGLVVAWQGLMSLLLAGPAGALIDRFGARRVVLPLYAIEAIGVSSYAVVHGPWQAFGAATICAVGASAAMAGQTTMMTSLTDDDERQHVFGLSFATLNLGIGVGGIVAGFIADVHRPGSFETIYVVNGVALIAPLLILLSMPSVGGPLVRHGPEHHESGGYREVLADRAFRRFVWFGLLLTASGYAQIEVGFPAFSSLSAGVTTRVVAWALAANTMTIVIAQLFVLRRLHGRSRSRALAVVGVVFALAWLILGAGAWAKSVSPAVPIIGVVLCATVFACGETFLSPVVPAVTNALAPDALRGRYNAMVSMIWGVTSIVGPLTAAPLIGHGLGTVWIVLIMAGSIGASLIALSLRSLLTPAQDGALDVGDADHRDADDADAAGGDQVPAPTAAVVAGAAGAGALVAVVPGLTESGGSIPRSQTAPAGR